MLCLQLAAAGMRVLRVWICLFHMHVYTVCFFVSYNAFIFPERPSSAQERPGLPRSAEECPGAPRSAYVYPTYSFHHRDKIQNSMFASLGAVP